MNAERVQSYASAFYEAALERWTTTLDGVAGALAGDPQLLARLDVADAEFAGRQRLLESVIPADADLPVRNVLSVLLQNGELGLLPELAAALRERASQTGAKPIPVEVISALPLTDDQRETLTAKLQAQYGSNLAFSYRVDSAILGGLIVRIGDKLIDGSVASKLAAMKQALGVTGD
jgi:F-type H+-transporting ATPase subunit delta